jgi:membrane-bound serine protease (ClpP class)
VALVPNIGFDFPSGAAISSAVWTLAITMVIFVGLVFFVGRLIPRSERFSDLVLAPILSSASGYTSADTHAEWIGQTGRTLTPLRPAGAADIGGRRVDVTTGGEFIALGQAVRVTRVRGSRVEVRAIDETAPGETLTS